MLLRDPSLIVLNYLNFQLLVPLKVLIHHEAPSLGEMVCPECPYRTDLLLVGLRSAATISVSSGRFGVRVIWTAVTISFISWDGSLLGSFGRVEMVPQSGSAVSLS